MDLLLEEDLQDRNIMHLLIKNGISSLSSDGHVFMS